MLCSQCFAIIVLCCIRWCFVWFLILCLVYDFVEFGEVFIRLGCVVCYLCVCFNLSSLAFRIWFALFVLRLVVGCDNDFDYLWCLYCIGIVVILFGFVWLRFVYNCLLVLFAVGFDFSLFIVVWFVYLCFCFCCFVELWCFWGG